MTYIATSSHHTIGSMSKDDSLGCENLSSDSESGFEYTQNQNKKMKPFATQRNFIDQEEDIGDDESSSYIGTDHLTKKRKKTSKQRVNNFTPDPRNADWYGNLPLHHCCSRTIESEVIEELKSLLDSYPEAVRMKNQFGRLPLHYALDRPKASVQILETLLNAFPSGIREEDEKGITPYDLAIKWEQASNVMKLLLSYDKTIDMPMYLKVNYGCLVSALFSWLYPPSQSNKHKILEKERSAYQIEVIHSESKPEIEEFSVAKSESSLSIGRGEFQMSYAASSLSSGSQGQTTSKLGFDNVVSYSRLMRLFIFLNNHSFTYWAATRTESTILFFIYFLCSI